MTISFLSRLLSVYPIKEKNSFQMATHTPAPVNLIQAVTLIKGVRTKRGPGVHGPPLWTGSMDHFHGPGPWTPCHGPGPWTVFFNNA